MKKVAVETQIAMKIMKRIRTGYYAPGTFIPSLTALAAEIHTSSTTISKALGMIRKKGFLEMIRGKGTRVIPINKRSQKGIVGIVVATSPALFRNEPSLILQGFYDTLEKNQQHYRIVLKKELDAILSGNQNLSDHFGGLLFIESGGVVEQIKKVDDLDFPYIVANLEEEMTANCTWIDHKKTTNAAVLMLAAMGHRRIALITKGIKKLFYKNALQGYKNGLNNIGQSFDNKMVIISNSSDAIGAYNAVNKFLESNPLPDAFVACRDYLAYGACTALKEKNIAIGRDVSIIGFDNLSWSDKNSYLTTFSEPAHELGAKAAEMLIELIDSGHLASKRIEVEAPLILRRSVGVNLSTPNNPNSISLKII